jgi:hypothetical protein
MKDNCFTPYAALSERCAPTEDSIDGASDRGEVHDDNAFAQCGVSDCGCSVQRKSGAFLRALWMAVLRWKLWMK